jgi:ADP-heptose:LPS heptosyltransferase
MRPLGHHAARLLSGISLAFDRPGSNKAIDRILLVNRFGVGDVLLSTPAVAALRIRFPNAHIAMMVRHTSAEILKNNPSIDQIISGRPSVKRSIRGFDLAILLTYCPFQSLWVRTIPYKVGYLRGYRVTSNGFPIQSKTWKKDHLVRLGNTVAESLGCPDPGHDLRVYPSALERESVKQHLPTEPFMAVSLQTKIPSKSWPLERMLEIVKWSPLPVVLVGGPNDHESARMVQHQATGVTNLAGQLSWLETAAVLEQCRAFLTADSGPMHVGFAVGAPTVALFGYTDPSQIFLASEERTLLCQPTACSPHFKVGVKDSHYEACAGHRCMTAITCEPVKKALETLLERPKICRSKKSAGPTSRMENSRT